MKNSNKSSWKSELLKTVIKSAMSLSLIKKFPSSKPYSLNKQQNHNSWGNTIIKWLQIKRKGKLAILTTSKLDWERSTRATIYNKNKKNILALTLKKSNKPDLSLKELQVSSLLFRQISLQKTQAVRLLILSL